MIDRPDRWPAVGAAVRTRMVAQGLTQADVARLTGLSPITIRKVMAGAEHNYRPANLTKIARALDWPADAIERILDGQDPAALVDDASRAPAPAGDSAGGKDPAGIAARIGRLRPAERAVLEQLIDTMLDE